MLSLHKVAAVIFDWAGTMIDHGSLAPVRTLQKVFSIAGIDLQNNVARRDMGLAKRVHIQKILAEPEISAQWLHSRKVTPTEADVEALYQAFVPLQLECLGEHGTLIDGLLPVVEELRASGVRIGATTGYTRAMLSQLEQLASAQGFLPDRSLCPEDVDAGRPAPFMCYQLAVDLKVAPLSACVKVGDTLSDLEEGRNAGMWTIGVLRTGNTLGLSYKEWTALAAEAKTAALHGAEQAMAGHAHYVIESVADLLPVLKDIDERLQRGEKPCC